MTEFTPNDQWRSFQTYVAAYLVAMRHSCDVLTISRRRVVSPPLAELRCDASGRLFFSVGAQAWSEVTDPERAPIEVAHADADDFAKEVVQLLRGRADVADPSDLRICASGPASSVSVLAQGGFANGHLDPVRAEALQVRMSAEIDVESDAIEAAARVVGSRVFSSSNSGSIAAIAYARELARLRTWIDPCSPTPETGYLVVQPTPEAGNDGN